MSDANFNETTKKAVAEDTIARLLGMLSPVLDGALAVGFGLDTVSALLTSGALLVSLKNRGADRLSVDKDGNVTAGDVATSWVASNVLPADRTLHRATTLADGRTLVAGGRHNVGAAQSATYLGTQSNKAVSWVSSTAMPAARIFFSLNTLPDGRVVAMGGNNGTAQNTVYFGTVTGDSIAWVAGTSLPTGLWEHAAVVLPDGRILVVGGNDDASVVATTYLGTVAGNVVTWVASTALPAAREGHTASLLPDGRVIVAGGQDAALAFQDSVYIGTVSGGAISWVSSSALPATLGYHAAGVLGTGQVLVTGGYNGSSGVDTVYLGTVSGSTVSWASLPPLPRPTSGHSMNVLPDYRPLVTGGDDGAGVSFAYVELGVRGGTVNGVDVNKISLGDMPAVASGDIDCNSQRIVNAGEIDGVGILKSNALSVAFTLDTVNSFATGNKYLSAKNQGTEFLSLYRDGAGSTILHKSDPNYLFVWAGSDIDNDASLIGLKHDNAHGRYFIVGSHDVGYGFAYVDGHTAHTNFEVGVDLGALGEGAGAGSSGLLTVLNYDALNTLGLAHPRLLLSADGTQVFGVDNLGNLSFGGVSGLGAWVSSTAMPAARYLHAACALPDGRVLVVGGRDTLIGSEDGAAYLGTVSGGAISWVASTAMPNTMARHTASALPDGRVAVVGGFRNGPGPLNTVYLGTVAGDAVSWVSSTPVPLSAWARAACVLPDGRILATGGTVDDNDGFANTYLGTVAGDAVSWVASTAMPAARFGHAISALPDGRVAVTGGYGNGRVSKDTVYLGTVTGDAVSWVSSTAMPSATEYHTSSVLPDGRVLVAGGSLGTVLFRAAYFGTVSGDAISWAASTPLPGVRSSHTASTLPDSQIVVTGGTDNATVFATALLSTVGGTVNGVNVPALSLSGMPSPPSADIDCGGQSIVNAGTVDGRDVAADGATLDALDGQTSQVTNTLYVDGKRVDVYVEDGGARRPFKTIQAAVDAVVSSSATNKYLIEVAPGAYYTAPVAVNKAYVTLRSCGLNGARISGKITVTNPLDPTPEQVTLVGLRISGGLECLASHICINVVDCNVTGSDWVMSPTAPTADEYLQVFSGLWYANATLTNVYTYLVGGGYYSTFTATGGEFNVNNSDINDPFEAVLGGTLAGSAFGNRAQNSKFTLNTGANLHIDADTEGGSVVTLSGGTLTRSTKAGNVVNDSAVTGATVKDALASLYLWDRTGGVLVPHTTADDPVDIGTGQFSGGKFVAADTLVYKRAKVTKTFADFAAAAFARTVNVFALPAEAAVRDVYADCTGVFMATVNSQDAVRDGTAGGLLAVKDASGYAAGDYLAAIDNDTALAQGYLVGLVDVPGEAATADGTPGGLITVGAAAVAATFTGQVAGMTTDVTVGADAAGAAGNSVSLVGTGALDVDALLAAWNGANPGNTATLSSGDGSQVPDLGATITLASGADLVPTALLAGEYVAVADGDTAAVRGYAVSVTDLGGPGPYRLHVQTLPSGGADVDLSAYTVAQAASVGFPALHLQDAPSAGSDVDLSPYTVAQAARSFVNQSAVTLEAGVAGTTNRYLASGRDVYSAPASFLAASDKGTALTSPGKTNVESFSAPTWLVARLTATGMLLSQLSGGSVDIYVEYSDKE